VGTRFIIAKTVINLTPSIYNVTYSIDGATVVLTCLFYVAGGIGRANTVPEKFIFLEVFISSSYFQFLDTRLSIV
jgi:hypothetical protein